MGEVEGGRGACILHPAPVALLGVHIRTGARFVPENTEREREAALTLQTQTLPSTATFLPSFLPQYLPSGPGPVTLVSST